MHVDTQFPGQCTCGIVGNHKGQKFFNSIERQAVDECTDALKYGPYVRDELDDGSTKR